MVLKKSNLLILFLVLTFLVGFTILYYNYKQRYVSKDKLLEYIQNNVITENSFNVQLRKQQDIDNKHIVIFTFNKRGNPDGLLGFAVFKIIPNNKYKLEKYSASSINPNIETITTQDEKGNNKNYAIFYGIIPEWQPNKYKVISEGREYIEELKKNEYFIKEFILKEGQGVQLIPIESY